MCIRKSFMSKSLSKNTKDVVEEPLLDKNVESLKSLLVREKRMVFFLEMSVKMRLKMKNLMKKKSFILKLKVLIFRFMKKIPMHKV